jgi:hypothetical protein
LCLQALTLISAYAALALGWGIAVLTLARMVLVPPTTERLRDLAKLSARSLGIAVILLAASAVLDGFRARVLSDPWRGWNAQAMGILLALPCCAALLYARFRSWIQSFGLLIGTMLVFTLILMGWYPALLREGGEGLHSNLGAQASLLGAGLLNLSLSAHAMLRYYFCKQMA